jgi:hypothetical protein
MSHYQKEETATPPTPSPMPAASKAVKSRSKNTTKETVVNERTGREIERGGVTYQNLLYSGLLKPSSEEDKALVKKMRAQAERPGSAGWRYMAPRRGTQRHEMRSKCGDSCFLMPAEEKFPVCPVGSCAPTCKGATSAYVRARQYHYTDVATKAKALEEKLCGRSS